MNRLFLAGIFLFMVNPGNASGQVAKLYPVDEAHENPSFVSFRLHLLEAIAERDTVFLYSHLATDVLTSFGGDGGVQEFKEYWNTASPDSDLWTVLARVVGGGGIFSDRIYSAPYYSAAFPSDEYNAFEYGAVVGENVNAYAEPHSNAKVIGSLSYDIIRVLDFYPHMNQGEGFPPGWVQIRLKDGQQGFMDNKFIGSAIGYRARFSKQNNQWLIISLVAGD